MNTTSQPNQVIVTVDTDSKVSCDPDPIWADGRKIHLQFLLQTDGYIFPEDNAIVVQNGGTEFPDPSRTVGPDNVVAKIYDHNSSAGTFKYTVTVQKVGGGQIVYDPTIHNGP